MENKALKNTFDKKNVAAQIAALALLPLLVAYNEFMLSVTGGTNVLSSFTTAVGMFLVAFALGLLLDLICLIPSRRKVSGWLCFALGEIVTIVFLLSYFLNDTFLIFMDPLSVLVSTGNVMADFSGTVFTLIGRGIPIILLYHVPSFVILYLAVKNHIVLSHEKGRQPIIAAVLFIIFAAAGPLTLTATPAEREKYTAEFTFDSSVRTFGLTTAMKLDTVYHVFGNPFDVIEIEPPVTVDPVEPSEPVDPVEPAIPAGPVEPVEPDEPDEPGSDIPNDVPEPIVYGDNALDIDFASLKAATSDKTLLSLFEYAESLTPSRKNEYTGLFEGKNLILITAEAFSAEVIDAERTPTLYRMANRGIVFEDYYQPSWGGSTSTGEFSVISGIIPVNKIYSVTQTTGHNMYFTMGNQLMRLGYESGAYHNGSYTYYSRNNTHMNYGYSEFIGMGNGMEKGVTERWPESDEEMFRYIMPKYIESGSPFSLYFMTVSGHCVYTTTGNSMSWKNYDKFSSLDASEPIKCYHAANYELELAMEYLIGALEEAGIADDTVIVISADHYPYGLEESPTWGTEENYLAELYGYTPLSNAQRDHNALIIWSGCLESRDEPIVVSSPAYSIDIVPTLSNLFGLEYDSRLLVGRDVLSDAEPLVIWPDYSWKTDEGYYHAPSGVFYPADAGSASGESAADKAYIDRIKTTVRNKISFSRGQLNYDFFDTIFPYPQG